jgi:hypothetical protein
MVRQCFEDVRHFALTDFDFPQRLFNGVAPLRFRDWFESWLT